MFINTDRVTEKNQTYGNNCEAKNYKKQSERKERLTFPSGLGDGFSCTLAHHLGDVDRTVHSVTESDGAEHRLCLQLCRQEVKKI